MREASREALLHLLAEPRLAAVLSALNGAGEETRVVGGAVRNCLLGAPVADIDLATTATPDIVMARAKQAGFKTAPTGLAHGTVTIICDNAAFETTSLREDIETDGRHAHVRFGRDFAQDALRRDFTINALSLSIDGVVHDVVGGLTDLAARRVRFIGDPHQRIAEDYLRILRFFRFHATYGAGPLDRVGFSACLAARAGLQRLSIERVQSEVMKLLVAKEAAQVVGEVAEAGLLNFALRGAAYPARFKRFIAQERARTPDSAPSAVARLGALSVVVIEDADRLRQALRLSNADYRRLAAAASALTATHDRSVPPSDASLGAFVLSFGAQAAADALALAQADRFSICEATEGVHPAGDRFAWDRAFKTLSRLVGLRLPISGDDLKMRGLNDGRAIGAMLKTLQARWIRAGFPREPAVLAQLIDDAVSNALAGGAEKTTP